MTGQLLNDARTELQNDGFSVAVINATSSQPAGTVIGQDPLAQVKVDKGSTVTLTVSSGPGNTTVPSVQGLPLAQAKREIRRAHLRVGRVVLQGSQTVPDGDVIGTDPAAGQNPVVGTRVTLTVSTGKPTAAVPPVVSKSESDATQALKSAGFTVSTSTETTSTATPGDGGQPVAERKHARPRRLERGARHREGADDRQGAGRKGRHIRRRSQHTDRRPDSPSSRRPRP